MAGTGRTGFNSIKEQSTQVALHAAPSWTASGLGYFNSDFTTDLVFQNSTTGEVQIWFMSGTDRVGFASAKEQTSGATLLGSWRIVGVGDMDRDGQTDILFQDPVSGQLQVWFMAGTDRRAFAPIVEQATQQPLAVTAPWRVGDFNSDGRIDVVGHNTTTGEIQVWLMDGTNRTSFVYVNDAATGGRLIGPSPWRLNGAGDVNFDGQTDIIFRNTSTGNLQVSFLNGVTRIGFSDVKEQATGAIISAPSPWVLVGD